MIQLSRLEKNERTLRAVTGLSKAEFEELPEQFEEASKNKYTIKCKDPNRKRKPGGGSKPILSSTAAQLVFILVYWKCYPTQDLQGFLFDMTQSAAHKWIYRLLEILEAALGEAVVLPARPATSTLQQLIKECPELEFVIDGVERPITRSHNSEKQKENYSGKTPYDKKHRHYSEKNKEDSDIGQYAYGEDA